MQALPPGLGTPPPPAAPADKSGPPVIDGDAGMRGLSAGGPLATDSQRGTAFLCLRAGEVVGIRGLRPIGIGVPYGYPAGFRRPPGEHTPHSPPPASPRQAGRMGAALQMLQGQTGSSHLQQAKPPRLLSSPGSHKQKASGPDRTEKQRFFHFVTPLTTMVGFLYPQHLQ